MEEKLVDAAQTDINAQEKQRPVVLNATTIFDISSEGAPQGRSGVVEAHRHFRWKEKELRERNQEPPEMMQLAIEEILVFMVAEYKKAGIEVQDSELFKPVFVDFAELNKLGHNVEFGVWGFVTSDVVPPIIVTYGESLDKIARNPIALLELLITIAHEVSHAMTRIVGVMEYISEGEFGSTERVLTLNKRDLPYIISEALAMRHSLDFIFNLHPELSAFKFAFGKKRRGACRADSYLRQYSSGDSPIDDPSTYTSHRLNTLGTRIRYFNSREGSMLMRIKASFTQGVSMLSQSTDSKELFDGLLEPFSLNEREEIIAMLLRARVGVAMEIEVVKEKLKEKWSKELVEKVFAIGTFDAVAIRTLYKRVKKQLG